MRTKNERDIQESTMTRMLKITIPCMFVFSFLTLDIVALAKPTREQIIAFSEECRNQKKRMDLTKKFGSDFSYLKLTGIDFRGYYQVDNETILTDVDFSYSNLRDARFGAAMLERADFSGADLEGAQFITATITGADFEKANLRKVVFQECDLSRANLSHTDLSESVISGCNFTEADLSHCILSGAKNEDLRIDFSRANLGRADLRGMNLILAVFRDADLSYANLENADLENADFTRANLTEANFTNADIKSTIFRNAHGLAPEIKDRLRRQSRRGLYDAKQSVLKLIQLSYWPAYFFVIIFMLFTASKSFKKFHKHKLYIISCITNLFALVPLGVILLMFTVAGHPVRQLGVPNPLAESVWKLWVGLWPLCYFVILGGIPLTLTLMVICVAKYLSASNKRDKESIYLFYFILTFLHYLFAYRLVTTYFPSA